MKWALITGASSGLGRALAVELARIDYALALVGKDQKRLEETIRLIPLPGRQHAKVIVADMTADHDVRELVKRCQRELAESNGPELLVNNAGATVSGPIEEIPFAEYERIGRLNFYAPVSLIQQALPQMKMARKGIIVNVSSGVARRGVPCEAPYCAAKAALTVFTESLRVEVAPFGIHVLLFSPGHISSRFADNRISYGSFYRKTIISKSNSPEWAARRCMRAIEKRKSSELLGLKAKVLLHFNYWCPSILDWLLGRWCAVKPNENAAREMSAA